MEINFQQLLQIACFPEQHFLVSINGVALGRRHREIEPYLAKATVQWPWKDTSAGDMMCGTFEWHWQSDIHFFGDSFSEPKGDMQCKLRYDMSGCRVCHQTSNSFQKEPFSTIQIGGHPFFSIDTVNMWC